jgi:hypothetical protein
VSVSKTHQELTKNITALAQNLRRSWQFLVRAAGQFPMELRPGILAREHIRCSQPPTFVWSDSPNIQAGRFKGPATISNYYLRQRVFVCEGVRSAFKKRRSGPPPQAGLAWLLRRWMLSKALKSTRVWLLPDVFRCPGRSLVWLSRPILVFSGRPGRTPKELGGIDFQHLCKFSDDL